MKKDELVEYAKIEITERAKKYFDVCDTDRSNYISKEEWFVAESILAKAATVKNGKNIVFGFFNDFDLNSDGKISEYEFVTVLIQQLESVAEEVDTDEIEIAKPNLLSKFVKTLSDELDIAISLVKNQDLGEWFKKVEKVLISKTKEYFDVFSKGDNVTMEELNFTQFILTQSTNKITLHNHEELKKEFDFKKDTTLTKLEYVSVITECLKKIEKNIKTLNIFDLEIFQNVYVDLMDTSIQLLQNKKYRENWFETLQNTFHFEAEYYYTSCVSKGGFSQVQFAKYKDVFNEAISTFVKSKINVDSVKIKDIEKFTLGSLTSIVKGSLEELGKDLQNLDVFELQIFEKTFTDNLNQIIASLSK
eukprot:gene7447-11770_t